MFPTRRRRPKKETSSSALVFKGIRKAPSWTGKKFDSLFESTDGGAKFLKRFGQRGASDFTIHNDVERKRRYIHRHKSRENWKDPVSPGALSRWFLWNTSLQPMSRRAHQAYCARFQRLKCALGEATPTRRLQGGRGSNPTMRTDPALWETAKKHALRKFKRHSARAMQYAVLWYKKRGGGYKTKRRAKDNSLHQWTKQKWTTKSGKPSGQTGERYLPAKIIRAMPADMYAETTAAKRRGVSQYTPQPQNVKDWIRAHR